MLSLFNRLNKISIAPLYDLSDHNYSSSFSGTYMTNSLQKDRLLDN